MADVRAVLDAVWRIESGKIIASLVRWTQDVGTAEEIAADAFVIALEQWPSSGVPPNPGAWLMSTAKHRAIDAFRRQRAYEAKLPLLAVPEPVGPPDPSPIEDDLLRLIFIACHPVLSTASRAALTLRMLGGLSTD